MEFWSRVLKIVAKISSIGLILWGLMFGVFGIIFDIDTHFPNTGAYLQAIFASLYAIGLGILYWFPNEKMLRHKRIYLTIMFLPILGLGIMSIYEIVSNGFDSVYIIDHGLSTILVLICLFLTAPLSLILHMRSKQNHLEK